MTSINELQEEYETLFQREVSSSYKQHKNYILIINLRF